MNDTLKIWCNADLPKDAAERLKQGVGTHQLVIASKPASNLSVGEKCAEMEGSNILFGQPDPDQALETETLRWIQITSAGYTRYDTDQFRTALAQREVPFCNSSSVYDEPCAQHILAFMLASARQLPEAMLVQASTQAWAFEPLRSNTRVLKGDRVLIVGFGAIARRLVELLAPFGLDIIAVRRRPRGDENVPCVSGDRLEEEICVADHVVNILPANEGNYRIFDSNLFAKMKAGAQFYNIGRGTTVDQEALVSALNSGHLGSALLDVTDPEPLPKDHPLWKAPRCTITPHIAGGFTREEVAVVNHFLANLRQFESAAPLKDRVF